MKTFDDIPESLDPKAGWLDGETTTPDSTEASKAAGGDCVSRLIARLRDYVRQLDTHQKKRRAALLLTEAADEIEILRIALADAIRRPMGVIPASAEGHITDEEIHRAEESRATFNCDGERIYSSHKSL